MPLDKLTVFTKKVQDLADKPNGTMTASEVKAQFDAAPEELRVYLNQLIDDLSSVADGDSGADNVKATSIAGLTGTTIQAILESAKTLIDTKSNSVDVYTKTALDNGQLDTRYFTEAELLSSVDNASGADKIGATPIASSPATIQGILEWLKQQIDSTVLGQIPDGSVTVAKLAFDPATQAELQTEIDALTTHKADDTSHVRYGVASGINPKTIALTPAPTTLVEGMALSFKNTTANTGATTLNVNGLGAKPILKSNGSSVASGNLKAGSIYTVRYDGTSFILQGEGGSGNAQPSDVLAGKTFTNDNGEQVGLGDADLIPTNIKKDVNIFNVVGTLASDPVTTFTAGSLNQIIKDTRIHEIVTGSYVKKSEISVKKSGIITVSFALNAYSSSNTVSGRIYKNGIAVGLERSTTNAYNTIFTENFTVSANDLIQLYVKTTGYSLVSDFAITVGNDFGYATLTI